MDLTNTQITFIWKPDSGIMKERKKKKKVIMTFYLTIQFKTFLKFRDFFFKLIY